MTPLAFLGHRLAPRHRAGGLVARFLRDESGSPAVEFALVAAPFIALTLALLQVGLIYFAQEALETGTEETARLVLTGQVSGQLNEASILGMLCPNMPSLFTCDAGHVMVDLQPTPSFNNANVSKPTLTYDSNGNVNNTWTVNAGAPNDIMVMRVMYGWPVYLGPLGLNFGNMQNNRLLLMATSVFKNEPPH